jgi:hypothetical protein
MVRVFQIDEPAGAIAPRSGGVKLNAVAAIKWITRRVHVRLIDPNSSKIDLLDDAPLGICKLREFGIDGV